MIAWRLIGLLALACAVLPLAGCQSDGLDGPPGKAQSTALGRPATYKPMSCWFEVHSRHPISCGQLVVPEDWTAAEGRSLHLPVVIFHTASGRNDAEPIVYLNGGPGGRSGLQTAAEIETWVGFLAGASWSRRHDVVVLAQRGTSWLDSELSCPGLSDPLVRVNAGEAPDAPVDWRESMHEAVVACRQRLTGRGYVLGAYNSTQSAQDVAALRLVLGLESWSLYGVSYGTRYALTVMRNHPEGIRSAVLDSPYPPQLARLGFDPAGFTHALDQVLDACAADALCHANYPDLRQDLTTTLAQLRDTPLQIPVSSWNGTRSVYLRVDDTEMLDALLSHLRRNALIDYVPNLIEEIRERPAAFVAHYQDYLFGPADRTSAEGAYLSIFCNDDYPTMSADYWVAEAKRHPLLERWLLDRPSVTPCALWPVAAIDARDKQPVQSAIPTLILAGTLDPTTPPANAYMTASTLDRAYVFEFPGLSHGILASDPCASDVVAAFLEDPQRRPDVACPGTEPEFSPSVAARASAMIDEGRGVQAEHLLKDLLAAQREAPAPAHRNLGVILNGLGRVYLERGSYAEAEPMFKKALAVNWKTRGRDDPAIAVSAFYLAEVYRAQGRRREAEPLYQRALRIEEAAYGPAHPELVTTLEAYAELLHELGRGSEARELESRAAAIERG